jgi:hypothetical protein
MTSALEDSGPKNSAFLLGWYSTLLCYIPFASAPYCVFLLSLPFGKRGHVLKGQCHEMVIEIIPWSSSLGLN